MTSPEVILPLKPVEDIAMADARVVANRLLELAAADGRGLTPMQVLKLVYIAHGWSLGLTGQPLIDQSVEAWQYGPVIPELYKAMKGFGNGSVSGPLPEGWGAHGAELSFAETGLVDQVYRLYGHMSGISLSRITHASNTPWDQTYSPGRFGLEIPERIITEHYQRLSRERVPTTNG